MSLYDKPHSITVRAARPGAGGGTPVYAEAVDRTVQITPATFDVISRNWGPDIKASHLLLCDLSDVEDQEKGTPFNFGAEINYGDRQFTVASAPFIYDEGIPTDHAEFAIQQRKQKRP